jgi:hypothetical protein
MATGDFLASACAISSTVESRWSWETTRLTIPSDCSWVAVHRSPSISISLRTLRGMLRERMAWIIIGQIPTLISGVPNVAVSTATRRSHEHARPKPPASAVAVDPADDRLAQLRHQQEQVDEQVAAAVLLETGHPAVEARQVGPGAEHAAGPR